MDLPHIKLQREIFKLIQCKKCDVNIPEARSEMGYDVCVGCSTEQKKVGHVIYPHKTGAFIQVMDRETRDNLDRLDRRGPVFDPLSGFIRVFTLLLDNSFIVP